MEDIDDGLKNADNTKINVGSSEERADKSSGSQTKGRGRFKRLKDYRVVINEKGKKTVVYEGTVHELKLDSKRISELKRSLAINSLLLVLFYVIGGIYNSQLSRVAYIVLPYVVIFLPLYFILFSLFYILRGKTIYSDREYTTIIERLRTSAGFSAVCMLACVLGSVYYLAFNQTDVLRQLPFVISCAVVGLAGFAINITVTKLILCFAKS